jgi:hypothetical protein
VEYQQALAHEMIKSRGSRKSQVRAVRPVAMAAAMA